MKRPRSVKRSTRKRMNERGAVLYLVAAMMIAFLGVAALAVDMGMWAVARSEAQRAAEAGAHAGASIFLYSPGDEPGARLEAETFAESNTVRNVTPDVLPIDDIDVLLDSQKVRVRVHRTVERGNPVGAFFAKAMGINTVDVRAVAAAQVWPANYVPCVLPFAIPDRWSETLPAYTWPLEDDSFDPANDAGDYYEPYFSDPVTMVPNLTPTGYHPTADLGTLIRIYAGDPQDAPQPSWWHPFAQPGGSGANDLREAIKGCVPGLADDGYTIGDEVDTEPGAMIGPIRQGFEYLINNSPGEMWDDMQDCVVLVLGESCINSKRVRPLVLYNPYDPPAQGRKPLEIANIAGVWVQSLTGGGNNLEVWVRFIEYTDVLAGPEWTDADSFLKLLRIVE